ncbi:hypothetical protein GCM10010211_78810 [Streptomyces albospinus]|uniref:Phosphatidylserine decarboxylase n=1 Tax=Streptomyces albospinus TaxID=285515 RepID=A0ABQ2VR80_9ACTN|nr:hypothetical protein GCM10010211_78810 [Streptomyces albospinus]
MLGPARREALGLHVVQRLLPPPYQGRVPAARRERRPRRRRRPNDGTVYNVQRRAARETDFWLKEQYSLTDMLRGPQCGDEYVSTFVGGDVYQSFLSVNSYHRWHVPVDGTVKHLEIVPRLMFSAAWNETPDPTT